MSSHAAPLPRPSAPASAPAWFANPRQAEPPDPRNTLGADAAAASPIVVVDYAPSWLTRFEEERQRLRRVLGSHARRIDHVGSTAVPGLAARPTIDIDVSVADLGDEESYLPALDRSGYEVHVGRRGDRMLTRPGRSLHLYVCQAGSVGERRPLLFRDWLRHHPADREAFAALKRQLALRAGADDDAYAHAKEPFVAEITHRALMKAPSRSS